MAIKKSDRRYRDVAKQTLVISSRLNLYNILYENRDNEYFLNMFRNFEINDEVKGNNVYFDLYYAEENDWWDNISYKYYDTSVLWYLICEMNDIVNPFEQLEHGQQIKVLKEGYLYNVFKNLLEISKL